MILRTITVGLIKLGESLINNMKEPLVSIIIPTYNYGKFITETLDDLKLQTYQNWEVIVIDDGSTDNTREVVRKYIKTDNRFNYFYQENNRQSAARNLGIGKSKGKFIQFLDADDKLVHHKLSNQLKIFNENPSVDIVYSNVRYFHDDSPEVLRYSMEEDDQPWMTNFSGQGIYLVKELILGNVMPINAPLFKRSIIDEIGVFNLDNNGYNEDWEYWTRCSFANKNFFYDSSEGSLALVRIHENSTSKNTLKMYKSGIIIRQKIDSWLKEDYNLKDKEALIELNNRLLGISIDEYITRLSKKDRLRGILSASKLSLRYKNLYYLKLSMFPKDSRTGRLLRSIKYRK